jgi:hypothetical protein
MFIGSKTFYIIFLWRITVRALISTISELLNITQKENTVYVPNIQVNIWLASSLVPKGVIVGSSGNMFVRGVFYQRMGVTLIKSFYCGDPQVIAYPNCIVWIKAPEAEFSLCSC